MKTAKVFKKGNGQAVRLPKEFRLSEDEVEIRREGDAILLAKLSIRWRTSAPV
jgi:antitoxin VapB